MKTAFIYLSLAAGLISTAASAQDSSSIGRLLATPASAYANLRFDLANVQSSRRTGPDGQVSSGLDVAVAPRLVASVEASVDTRGLTANGVNAAPIFRQESSVTGRLGIVVGSRGLLYGRFGYTELDTNYDLAGLPASRRSLVGVLVGAGSEVRLSPAVSLRSEYQVVDYAGSATSNRVVSGLVFRF